MLSQRKLNSRKTLVVFSPLLYRQHRYACTLILEIFSLASPPPATLSCTGAMAPQAPFLTLFPSLALCMAAGRRRHFSADNKSIAGPPNQPPRKLPGGHARFVLLFLRIFHLLMQAACCAFFPARARRRACRRRRDICLENWTHKRSNPRLDTYIPNGQKVISQLGFHLTLHGPVGGIDPPSSFPLSSTGGVFPFLEEEKYLSRDIERKGGGEGFSIPSTYVFPLFRMRWSEERGKKSRLKGEEKKKCGSGKMYV